MARWTAPLLIGFVFAGLIGMGIWHVRQHLPTPQEWARLLEAEWTKALAMPVQVEAATVGLTGAILHQLRIQPDSRSPTGYLLTVPELWLRWSVRQWLRPSEWRRTMQAQLERALRQIVVSNAILFLWRDRRGVWNWQPMWATRPIRRPMRFPLIKIHNGEIVLGDETLPLPDDTPFRLHLVAVDATVQPSEGGIFIEAQGRLKEPLGAPNSWVSVTIRQVSLEGMQETHGRLQLSRLRLSALPQKWRHFAEGQVWDGEMVNAVLHWHQTDAETSLSGTATLLRLSARHPRIHLAPLDVEVALALHFVHPKPPSWQVNLRTLKVHPQLGSGMVALEGQQGFWRIRWRGEQVPIAILQLLVPQPLPLHGGTVKGSLAAEIRKHRWQVDADVTVQRTALRLEGEGTGDKGQVKEGQLLAIAVPHGRGQVRLEQNGNRWHGTVEMAAETAIGKVSAFLWLRDFGGTGDKRHRIKEGQGRAIVKVQNLRLRAFRSLLHALLPKQWRQKVQLHDGFVTGEAAVGWRGRRWWLERMSGRFSEVALDSLYFPPLRASAQIRADGQRMHFSSLQVQFDRRVLAQFSGQTTLERQPLWQVQGQLSPDAIERLSAWAMARWKLPVHLLTGGKGKVHGSGVGTQWQAQLCWDEPIGLLALPTGRWQWTFGRLTLLVAPQGGFASLNAATAQPLSRLSVNEDIVQLPNGVQFSEWWGVWDAQKRTLTIFGSVKVPQLRFNNLLLQEVRADLEGHIADKGITELFARNLAAAVSTGKVTDGQLWWRTEGSEGQETKEALTVSLKVHGVDLAELRPLTNAPDDIAWKGRFNGTVTLHTDFASALKANFAGEILDGQLRMKDGQVRSARIALDNFSVHEKREGKEWRLSAVAGSGTGMKTEIANGNRSLRLVQWQLQGMAERQQNGWRWDVRVPKAKMLGGEWSGQGHGSPEAAQGHFSFAQVDIAELSRFWKLNSDSSMVTGKGSGWVKWTAVQRNKRWEGSWEAATLFTDSKWQDWFVKAAGIRAHGQWRTDEKSQWKEVDGEVDGIHLLAEDGQAVLSGNFAFRQGKPSLNLQGRWTGVSLRRWGERWEIPTPLQGLAEGTVRIRWDGEWLVSGTVKVPTIAIGEGAVLRHVTGEWEWRGDAVHLRSVRARWSDGNLTADATLDLRPSASSLLTLQGDDLALENLMRLLREWKVPLSDWQWHGKVDGRAQVVVQGSQRRAIFALDGAEVRLGTAPFGTARIDLTMTQHHNGEKAVLLWQGQAQFHRNGMVATTSWSGNGEIVQVRWQSGKVPTELLKAVVSEWRRTLPEEAKGEGWERWLRLPLSGEVWSEGSLVLRKGQIADLTATMKIPNLRGIGDRPAQLAMSVQRDGTRWLFHLTELRQDRARAEGVVSLDDKGQLAGTLTLHQVSPELVGSVLALLGIPTDEMPMPEGTLTAQLQLAGTKERPLVDGRLIAEEVHWRGWWVRQLLIRRFQLREGVLSVAKGDGILRWRTEGTLASFWGQMELTGKRKFQWHLELPPTPLDAVLPPDLPVAIDKGWVSGSLSLQGALRSPQLFGTMELAANALTFGGKESLPAPLASLTMLRDVRCQVTANGRTVQLTRLTAKWSEGTVSGEGWLQLREGGLQNFFANEGEWLLRIQEAQTNWDGMSLQVREAELRGQVDNEGLCLQVVRWQGNGVALSGSVRWRQLPTDKWAWLREGQWEVTLRVSDFRWRIKGARGELSGTVALRTEREKSPPVLTGVLTVHDGDVLRLPVAATGGNGKWQLPPAVQLALTLQVGDRFFLRNPQVSFLLGGEVALRGDLSQPRMEGELRSRRGTLRLPASVLTITDMSLRLAYAVDPLTHQWVGTARLRLEGETQLDIHRILFTVSGPVDEQSQRLGILPTVTMLAIPPLPERTALERMFGLGLAQLSEALTNWQQLFSGVFVQSFMGNLLAPVTEPIVQALRWTELSVIREQTTKRQWLRLGIPLAPRLHVLWRQGLSPVDPSALEVQYYFGKRTSVTVIKRERERAEFRVQTSVRF